MPIELPALRPLEALKLTLRHLYEQYGYAPYAMTHMEEYAFYMENRNFLEQPEIAVFTDLDGRLMALKPDVTLSIVRSIPADGARLRRLYYAENVFRPFVLAGAFRELSQMGLECIGPVTAYAVAEVVSLAERSLAATGREYVLELSHLDLVSALLEELAPPIGALPALLACVKQKNAHDLRARAEAAGLPAAGAERLLALVSAPGTVPEALRAARRAAGRNMAMQRAADALEQLCEALDSAHVRLEFSIISDTAYYNGLAFRGYVQGAPVPVLRGGEYGNLLARMGKDGMRAIGFALYLGELERCLPAPAPDGGGTLLLYQPETPAGRVCAAVASLVAAGERVTALTEAPPDGRFARVIRLEEWEEGAPC